MSEIAVRSLTARYDGALVLGGLGISLDVAPGSTTVVLGPSGCGKTTLLRCLAGLHRPDGGTITIGGRTFDNTTTGVHVRPEDRRLGVVFQNGALFPHLDVAANVGFGLARSERRGHRVDEALELVGLAGLGARRPDQLSGGQRQRVALARALAPRPTVLLLDEPFSSLDAVLRAQLRDDVAALLDHLGTTAVLVTHDRAEAFVLGDHLVLLRDGSVVASGDAPSLYRSPPDAWTAAFLGEINETADGRLLRPEEFELIIGERGAVVERIEFCGADSLVTVQTDREVLVVRTVLAGIVVGDHIGVAPRRDAS